MVKIPSRYRKMIESVRQMEEMYSSIEDLDMVSKTKDFKERINNPKERKETLISALALCDVAINRALGITMFDVQIYGSIVLCENKIAEMKTGEGKTIVAVAAAYFLSLEGKGVHVVTVNDYLAKTQSNEMKPVFEMLGVTCGCVLSQQEKTKRQESYACDITYVTNKELGFDYLRDNLAHNNSSRVLRGLHNVIIDEVDSILIDEARTPLIIAGSQNVNRRMCQKADAFVKKLKRATGDGITTRFENLKEEMMREYHDIDGDYIVDETYNTIALTAIGTEKAEIYFKIDNLADEENIIIAEAIKEALTANYLMEKDHDYVVKDNQIMIVDEFTGRIMKDRRYSNGLHQAIEAKEHVDIKDDNKISASITLQNFFKLYDNYCGMTGTAKTSAKEFKRVYQLPVVVIPTNKPMIRKNMDDKYYANKEDCYDSLISDIKELHDKEQPVLIGTQSVFESEKIAKRLDKEGISYQLLNAKNDEREARIVSQAGKSSSVTIATNMAGRGTDILLGGNADVLARYAAVMKVDPYSETYQEDYWKEYNRVKDQQKMICDEDHIKVTDLGGLFVMGVGRNTSKRIDDQLIGRAGRQGDPGMSRFYISYEDELIKIYGNNKRNAKMFAKSPRVAKNVVHYAQKRIQNISADTRKSIFEMDSVSNNHRKEVYSFRDAIINTDDIEQYLDEIFFDVSNILLKKANAKRKFSSDSKDKLISMLMDDYKIEYIEFADAEYEEFVIAMRKFFKERFEQRITEASESNADFDRATFLKDLILYYIDKNWNVFLTSIEVLRMSTSMNAFGALTPLQAFKIESMETYDAMIDNVKEDIVKYLINMSTTKNSYKYEKLKNIVVG